MDKTSQKVFLPVALAGNVALAVLLIAVIFQLFGVQYSSAIDDLIELVFWDGVQEFLSYFVAEALVGAVVGALTIGLLPIYIAAYFIVKKKIRIGSSALSMALNGLALLSSAILLLGFGIYAMVIIAWSWLGMSIVGRML